MRPTKAPIHKIIENIAMGGFTDSPTEICCYDRKYMVRELEHGLSISSVAEEVSPWAIISLLYQWLMVLLARRGMHRDPAKLAEVLQTCDIATEKWGKLASTSHPIAFVTHLVIKNIWFDFNLETTEKHDVSDHT